MMSEQAHGESMRRVREWFYDRVAVLAMRDYRAAGNPHCGKHGRIHRPYGLGAETVEARNLYALALAELWTDEQEQQIKGYKLRTELLLVKGAIA